MMAIRLFDEVQAKTRDLTEALTYQTTSSDILGVIASSPTDIGPVLKAIVETMTPIGTMLEAGIERAVRVFRCGPRKLVASEFR
jgi:hypothetical protein